MMKPLSDKPLTAADKGSEVVWHLSITTDNPDFIDRLNDACSRLDFDNQGQLRYLEVIATPRDGSAREPWMSTFDPYDTGPTAPDDPGRDG
jgi:hypothetical protein